jgi:hypothetical protein
MSVVVNGTTIGSWFWDQDLGSANASAAARATKTFFDVTLRPGDTVELVGFAGPGEPLRTDYIDFQFLVPLTAGNQRPNNVRPAAVSATEDVAFAFTGANAVSVSDPDSSPLTTTLTATNGVMTVATGGAAAISGDGTATITLVGAPAAINAALAGLQFTPSPNYSGPASIVIQTSDGALLDTDSIAITVAPVNDAPTAQDLAAQTPRNTELAIVLPIADVEDSAGQLVVAVAETSAAGGQIADNGDGTVTYTPPAGFTGADSFTYSVTDTGLLSSPTRTVSITVTAPNAAPTAQSASAPNITVAGGVATTITVTYTDDGSLNVASFDPSDIVVTGPGGALTVTGVSVNTGTDGSPRTVTYTVAAPGGTWDSADNGAYTVSLVGGQVFDTLGQAAAAAADIAGFTVSAPPPSGAFRIEAEALQLVQGFAVASNSAASNRSVIAAVGTGEQIARYGFVAADGLYDVTVGYFDENDGVAQLGLFVNNVQIDQWLWNGTAGAANPTAQSKALRDIQDVALKAGDVVELRGFGAPGEPLRTDFIDFAFDRPIPSAGFRVEAETLSVTQGFITEAIGPQASGNTVLRASSGAEQVASYAFGAAAGLYRIDLRYFDENDGDAQLSVLVNGAVVDSFVWNEDLGSPVADFQTQATRAIASVVLRPGDTVSLRGFGDFEPPGVEPLRIDYLDFDRIGDVPPPFRVEAETFAIVQGFVVANNTAASGRSVLAASSNSVEQIARLAFSGASGIYDLGLGYFDENDGVARMRVFVDGEEIDDWLWNGTTGSANPTAQSSALRSIEGVAIAAGDVIELRGFGAPGEPLRTDFLDFAFVSGLPV